MRNRLVGALSVACLVLAACGGDDGPSTVKLYDRAPVPGVPDRTAAVVPSMSTFATDGEYWAELSGGAVDQTLTFLVTQAFFADACVEELGAEECPDDFGTLDEPSALVTVKATDIGSATVVADNRQNFAVTAEELFILAGGQPPSEGAPEGFAYVQFPYLLTVRDSTIVKANQIWLP